MNVKSFLAVVPLLLLTACAAPPQKTAFNPEGLHDRVLILPCHVLEVDLPFVL